jgi:hypothetical protein
MRIQETIAFYLVFGAGVAGAMLLGSERRSFAERFFTTISAALFWPMYLPLLLSRPATPAKLSADQNEPLDEMAAAIARVNTELDAALSSLDGWAEDVLVSERGRMTELRTALIAHAARIRSMDALLAGPSLPVANRALIADAAPAIAADLADVAGDRRRQSEVARLQNVARLAAVRRQSHADLMATLAWIRELVSMIHLAKFTGAPASRAEELVAQIAASVEGISAIAGHTADQPAVDNPQQPAEPTRPEPTSISTNPDGNRRIETWASSNAPAT